MTSVRFNRSTDGLCKKVSNSRLGDTKSFPDRKRLTAFAHIACGLKKARTLEVLGRVVAGVKRSINDVRRYSKVHPDFAPAGARLIAALESADCEATKRVSLDVNSVCGAVSGDVDDYGIRLGFREVRNAARLRVEASGRQSLLGRGVRG